MSADRPAPTAEQLLADPSASDWLRQAVQTGLRRDPVDVAGDAQVLATVFSDRAMAILGAGR